MDVQTISIVVAAVGVFIAAINSIYASRRAEQNDQQTLETRQAQLYMQIYSRWNSRESVRAYGLIRYKYQWNGLDDFLTKYGADVNPEAYSDFMLLGTFFEGLGVLVKQGLVDLNLVKDLLSHRIIWYFENVLGPMLTDIREVTQDPTQYDHVEYLYHALTQR
jgi:hypothetical protein